MKNTSIDTTLHAVLQEEYKKTESKESSSTLSLKRSEAFQNFRELGFPSVKNEEWKYTNLSKLVKEDFSNSPLDAITGNDIASHLFPIEGTKLVFINGIFSKELSTVLASPAELVLTDLKDADKSITEKYFARKTYSSKDGLSSLNTAFAQNGLLIEVKKNTVPKHPILIYYTSDSRKGNVLVQPRLLFIAEENAQVSLVETFVTIGSNTDFTNSITEIVLKQDAIVDYYKIQDGAENSYHVGSTEILHEAKSVSNSTTITLGGAITRNNLNITLDAEHCEAYLNGLYLLNDNQHVDNHTIADHAKPNCYSNELYKGVMDGKSTGVFNGKIFVKLDAQKTNAFQSNKNILLSKDASVNTKPQLEIFADDVKCSHGATTGQLDEEALFYLRSRGIGEMEAKKFLLHAFANDVLERIKIEPLKAILLAKIEERLA